MIISQFLSEISATVGQSLEIRATDTSESDESVKEVEELRQRIEDLEKDVRRGFLHCLRRMTDELL